MTLLDRYFKTPILWDILIGVIIVLSVEVIRYKVRFELPVTEKSLSLISDLSTISLTFSGFILTFLTVIVTFKTASKKPKLPDNSDVSLFDLFFNTKYYYRTTRLLKGSIKSLVCLSVIGLVLKMVVEAEFYYFVFYFNIFWLAIISLTIWRNLMILTMIIGLQKEQE